MRSMSACRLLLIGTSISRKRPPTGTAGLARVLVSGQRRLPWPPPSTAVTASRAPPSRVIGGDDIAGTAIESATPHARRPVRPAVPGAHRRPLRARRGGAARRALRAHLARAHRTTVAGYPQARRRPLAGGELLRSRPAGARRRRAGQAAGPSRSPARRARAAPGA